MMNRCDIVGVFSGRQPALLHCLPAGLLALFSERQSKWGGAPWGYLVFPINVTTLSYVKQMRIMESMVKC
jgi:hypothetical protein